MSKTAKSLNEALERLEKCDQTLTCIDLWYHASFPSDAMELIDDAMLRKMVRLIRKNKSVTEIDLPTEHLSVSGIAYLASMLAETSIETISLRSSLFHVPNTCLANSFFGALDPENQKLKDVKICKDIISTRAARKLVAFLATNKSVVALDIASNDIRDDAIVLIASALQDNRVVKDLDIGHNPFGVLGNAAIQQMMRRNKTILTIKLDGLTLHDDVPEGNSMHFLSCLSENDTINSINLGPIPCSRLPAYMSNLPQSRSLKSLNLSVKEYDESGTNAFAQWFETAHIQKLKLDWKGEDEPTEFISRLAPSLRSNQNTTGFHLNATGTNDAGCRALRDAFQGNKVLDEIIITDLSMTSQQFHSIFLVIPTMPNLATFVCWQASSRIKELRARDILGIVEKCQKLLAFYVGPLDDETEALIKHHMHHNQIKSRDLLHQDVTPLWAQIFGRLSEKKWTSELYSIIREKPELMKTDYPITAAFIEKFPRKRKRDN
jgi:hypothetical protein